MKLTQGDLQEALASALARHHVPGASVAVFSDGALVTAAAGITNVTTGVELTPETVMHIGSITKVFTTTLVMQLVDAGEVELEGPVLRYLPDLKLRDREALGKITVRMLLNHTSGIDGTGLPNHGHDEETIEKGVMRLAELGQISAPGTEFSYCNAGMIIAGYLAQRLSRKSWYELVRKRIFEPLALEYAATLPEEALLHRASVGHYHTPAARKPIRTPVAFGPLSRAPSGTTLMLSAKDLITFVRAHMDSGLGSNGARILSERSAKAMQHKTVDNRGKRYTYLDVGLGWMVAPDGLLHHAGGGPGIASVVYAQPDKRFAAAILTNAEYSLGMIGELLAPWLRELGNNLPLGMMDIHVPTERVTVDYDRYAGVYEDRMSRFHVSRTPEGLGVSRQARITYSDRASLDPTPVAPLIPLGDDEFLLAVQGDYRLPEGSRIFSFRNPDAAGRMQHLGNVMVLYKRPS